MLYKEKSSTVNKYAMLFREQFQNMSWDAAHHLQNSKESVVHWANSVLLYYRN